MSKVNFLSVKLEKLWDGHEAGETVTVEDYTANSMVKKGYGKIVATPKRSAPAVETADAPPAAEQAIANPVVTTPSDERRTTNDDTGPSTSSGQADSTGSPQAEKSKLFKKNRKN